MNWSIRWPALLISPNSSWIFNAAWTCKSSTLKVPMAILDGATASPVDCVDGGVAFVLPELNMLAVVLDHVLDLGAEPEPEPDTEWGEDPAGDGDTWCDSVSSAMAVVLHEALCVQPAACWYQAKTREMIDA